MAAAPDYFKMFVTHFGSSISGATVWWDKSTTLGSITAYMFVNTWANPYIIESSV